MQKPIKVVLIESSFLIISGIEKMLAELPGILLAEVFDGDEKKLEEKIMLQKPDVVIMNPVKVEKKLRSLSRILEHSSDIIVVGLCEKDTPANIGSHFRYKLNIESEKHELMQNFRSIVKPLLKNDENNKDDLALTEREKNILRLIAFGFSSMEIADNLFLSIHTINTHRKNILKKLGIKTVSGLMVYALMNNLVSIDEIEGK